jgi:hypothetical protein
MTPDFSPAMLRLFLYARLVHLGRPAINTIYERSDVSWSQLTRAFGGRLTAPGPRLALWRALDINPEASGVRLTSGGKQEDLP